MRVIHHHIGLSMILAVAFALALSSIQQAAPASTVPTAAAPAAETAPAPAADPANEQVCRRQPIEGSRRGERVCHTRAQWDQIRENARNNRDQASRAQRE